MEVPPGAATVSAISTEAAGSTPPTVPPAAPLVTSSKYTPLTPAPGTLEWGCTPTALHSWFQAWEDFWRVNWLGNTPSQVQVLNLVKVNLSEEWHNALTEFDWNRGSMKNLYTLMDLKLEI